MHNMYTVLELLCKDFPGHLTTNPLWKHFDM